ncbi:MAG: RHS repeat-associated core domain-containing protein [Caldilineaceae bacterium]
MKIGSTLTYLHGDHLGSTVLETNASGAVATDEKYFAFGKQRDSGKVVTDQRFTGQKEDGSGLMYYSARFYDPQTGMFVSPDTMVPDAGRVSAYNRTLYARGNPLIYNDPSGHEDVCSGVCPAPGIDPQIVQQAIQQTVDMARSAGPYAAPYVAGAASVPIVAGGGYIVTMWAIQDNGPAYVVPTPYDPGAIQESYPLPGSTTVTIQGTPLTGDGLTTSIPGTSDTGIGTPQDPGVTLTSPGIGGNVYTAQPQGGTYIQYDPLTGQIMRTGRTNNLARREREHAGSGLDFEVDSRTDNPAARRGREQIIHDTYNPPLNYIKPIADTNPRRPRYMRAGRQVKPE